MEVGLEVASSNYMVSSSDNQLPSSKYPGPHKNYLMCLITTMIKNNLFIMYHEL